MSNQKLESGCRRINSMYFNGSAVVMGYEGRGVMINIATLQHMQGFGGAILPGQHGLYQPTFAEAGPAMPTAAEPVFVSKEGVYVVPQSQSAQPYIPSQQHMHVSVPVQPIPQMARNQMRVIIPRDCTPGSMILVNTPTGSQIQIQIPFDRRPGDEIIVEY
jgi:hypothetical protein